MKVSVAGEAIAAESVAAEEAMLEKKTVVKQGEKRKKSRAEEGLKY